MTPIQWDDSFSVNIKEIDDQHRLLVNMINDLCSAMEAGKEKELLEDLIKRLSSYALVHFGREEHYFDQFKYPDADSHKHEHNHFETKIAEFEQDFKKGRGTVYMDILNYLSNWLVGHIKRSDRKYAPLFIENGIK